MFEFSSRLKTISYVLILIGAISVGFSFLAGGSDHHDEASHGEGEHATTEAHHSPAASHAHGHDAMPKTDDFSYHKGASRAIPKNNHFYTSPNAEHDAEHAHHQEQNKPWANLLVNSFFALAIGLGALFFMALQYAAQVGWTVVLLRVLEGITSFIWVPGLVILIIIVTGWFHLGGNHVYHWMAEGIMIPGSENYDSIIAGKEGYLNGPFFTIRSIIYLAGWIGAAFLLRKMSLKMEQSGVDYNQNWAKMRNVGAGFLVFFAVTSSMSAWDWIMSIDTHWFSTLFGWYVFSTIFVSSLTALMMVVLYLKGKGYLPEVNKSHIHDIAKFMFAFSIFWTYLWFSQYMLIWYSNIPEEVTYYMMRFDEYKVLFFTMVALNFIFPVTILMSRDSKRNRGFIFTAGIIILFGHWLDIFIMIMPGSVGASGSVTLINMGTLLGFVGLFILVVFNTIKKAPLMIKNHPMFVESKHFHI
ncbi:MAG: quinol:cytochrome C oxidoreductase [Bacteroidetes bacterium]|nr:MAG: quinol:cytochrome C oxidoreductase [Bacteroidota bacterium]